MSKDKTLSEELNDVKKKKIQTAVKQNAVIQMLKGVYLFAEGSALATCSAFAIYQGHFGHYPAWGKDGLLVAGVLVVIPAFILLSKFFRAIGKE